MESSEESRKHLALLKNSVRTTYQAVGKVYCPILGENIVFNSIGFRHLYIKPDGTYKDVNEAIYKLTLFPLAIPVIKNAVGISDERDVKIPVGRGRRRKFKQAKTYSLTAVVGRKTPVAVRVIILKIGNGNHIFYSIMKN